MHDPFARRIGLGGVALVKGRLINGLKSMPQDELNFFLKKKGIFSH